MERVAIVGDDTVGSFFSFSALSLSLESMSSLEEGEVRGDLFEGRKADKADLMALLGIDRRVPGVDVSLVGSAVDGIAWSGLASCCALSAGWDGVMESGGRLSGRSRDGRGSEEFNTHISCDASTLVILGKGRCRIARTVYLMLACGLWLVDGIIGGAPSRCVGGRIKDGRIKGEKSTE